MLDPKIHKDESENISDALSMQLIMRMLDGPRSFSDLLETQRKKLFLILLNIMERMVNKDALNLTGLTPHDVIYHDDLLSVLHYHPLKEKQIRIGNRTIPVEKRRHRIPLVYVPPLLAPGFAFDLYPERSLARYFLARGFDVYLLDFGSPDKSHAHLSFGHYILNWLPASIERIRKVSGQDELSMMGYCMGGLFILLYTAVFHDPHVRNIVTVSSPIDIHQMGAAGQILTKIAVPVHKIARRFNLNIQDVDPKYLHVPGLLGTIGFNMTNPMGFVKRQWDFLLNLWDRDFVAVHDSLGYWINNLLDYPGATIQEMALKLGIENRMVEGSVPFGDKEAKLKDIQCAMLSFAGRNDEIVPVASARKILDVVSSDDKTFLVVPGGHVGAIIGNKAPTHLWKTAADWLAERSI